MSISSSNFTHISDISTCPPPPRPSFSHMTQGNRRGTLAVSHPYALRMLQPHCLYDPSLDALRSDTNTPAPHTPVTFNHFRVDTPAPVDFNSNSVNISASTVNTTGSVNTENKVNRNYGVETAQGAYSVPPAVPVVHMVDCDRSSTNMPPPAANRASHKGFVNITEAMVNYF